jgi:hypothetical protein
MKKYIDPPRGWIYGFPKEIPEGVKDINAWLVENGYPKNEIERLGDYFFCRYWHEDDSEYRATTKEIEEEAVIYVEKTNTNMDNQNQELTFGEQLVGLQFNPSGDEKVQRAKLLCSQLADLLHEHHYNSNLIEGSLRPMLYDHAICEILNAQMNVVKVLTLKY